MPDFAIQNPAPPSGNNLVDRKTHGCASTQHPNPQVFGLLFKEVNGGFHMDLGVQIPAEGGHDWSVEFTDPLNCSGLNDCALRVETLNEPIEADQILCNVPGGGHFHMAAAAAQEEASPSRPAIEILTPAEIPITGGDFMAEGEAAHPNYKVAGVVIRQWPGVCDPPRRHIFLGKTRKQPNEKDKSWRISFTNIPHGEVLELRVMVVAGGNNGALKKLRAQRSIKLT